MTDLLSNDGPELVPPAELLALRAQLSVAPGAEVRRSHLEAIVAQVRIGRRSTWGRVASGAARSAAAVVVTLTITTGLAAAQVLPQPAQKILSTVSDRFGGGVDSPDVPDELDEPAAPEASEPVAVAESDDVPPARETTRSLDREPDVTATTSTTVAPTTPVVTTPPEPEPTPTTTTTTTIPGPTSPESPVAGEEPVEEPVEGPDGPVDEPTDPATPTDPEAPTDPAPAPEEPTEPAPPVRTVRTTSEDGVEAEPSQDGGPG